MRRFLSTELIVSVFSLLIAFIVVHAFYVAVVRPNANAFLEEERAAMAINPDYVQQRSIYVVIRDYEQEACFIMMIWALAILGYKWRSVFLQQNQLDQDFVGLPEGARITPEDTKAISGRIRQLPEKMRDYLLPRVLLGVLERFASTKNIQDASLEVHGICEEEASRLGSELSIIRYIAWAIPSIGFIGTVRGIGEALAQAHRAVEGDITGVTESLGVAFNSTFVALLISIVLMFIIHQIQQMQERLVLDSSRYCSKWVISRFQSESE